MVYLNYVILFPGDVTESTENCIADVMKEGENWQ